MVTCPVCDSNIDVDTEEIDEGDSLSCDECGADLKVLSVEPLELEAGEEEDDEEDDEDFDDEDDEDEEEEEEEDDEEDWK